MRSEGLGCGWDPHQWLFVCSALLAGTVLPFPVGAVGPGVPLVEGRTTLADGGVAARVNEAGVRALGRVRAARIDDFPLRSGHDVI